MQLIGALMRDCDPAPIRTVLSRFKDGKREAADAQKQLRIWRDALVGGDDAAMQEIIRKAPGIDRQHFSQLIRSARKELAETKPPRFSRELFRFIRDATAPPRQSENTGGSDNNSGHIS